MRVPLDVDPFVAVQTSNLDPLPHQIDAAFSRMLDPQALRFLLADDPGAGKTIMAGRRRIDPRGSGTAPPTEAD